ncbi:hypothetical protein PIB30_074747 [Stylosanthes scabra]|uniref:Uncharacterized protein n=1 Tax=Stylosanthes scabra TaxID=79078 RepID=A0ABU6TRU1_9FABA|nr:hypothetical protein [Stylosanthes scabra]
MQDTFEHWFLMVIGLTEGALFMLGSFHDDYIMWEREKLMRDTVRAIMELANSNYVTEEYKLPLLMPDWPVANVREIPNCSNSENSSAWVINWLQMQDEFKAFNHEPLKDLFLRGKTAVNLVTSVFNMLKRAIEKDAVDWLRLRSARASARAE